MTHAAEALAREALAGAKPAVYWTDVTPSPAPTPGLADDIRADLAIVGGGFTGLWAAVQAAERDPGRDIVVLEAGGIGSGASGRNGGFVAASLTHGLAHGHHSWPSEMPELLRQGRENLAAIGDFVARHGIDADLRLCGKTTVATEPHQVAWLEATAKLHDAYGEDAVVLDRVTARGDVDSPTYLAGLRIRSGYGLVNPASLVHGLSRVAAGAGARIFEHSRVVTIEPAGGAVRLATPGGSVTAERVIVATNAFPAPLPRIRRFIVPFYDYVLATEPLDEAQWRSLGWTERQGITDAANFFHYYRPTADGRILWGGYDAVYHYGSRVAPELEQRLATHQTLAQHFFTTFPQLAGIRFSHRWGGAIDSTSRFTPVFGRAFDGRVAYAIGFTGLGVASTRHGAAVALDLVDDRETALTSTALVRSQPRRFPPEPLRWLAVRITQAELARQDRQAGRPTLWLRMLERMGMGFTS